MIKTEHLTKRFKKKLAVDDISFEAQSGKVTGFLGPNGAGKSTTMRLMLSLDNGGGRTTFGGKKLSEYSQPSKVVGILLEAKAFHPTRTARNHLRVLADAGNIPMRRVDEAIDLVGMTTEIKKGPGKFSLGMAQRLGIAAAVLGEPKYLVLDEPANGLDPEGIAWLRNFLKEYADKGNAVFVSSHLLSEMSQMADDVVVIGKGKLIANTSMATIIADSSRTGIFVRVTKTAELEKVLRQKSFNFTKEDDGFKITGVATDEIGKLAFAAGLPILELAKQNASLEEAFLDLTEGAEEFKIPSGGKK
ncbi:MAG: ATP-binding cassette domain-containing protein [Candidatus Saccharimonadales bacterium]